MSFLQTYKTSLVGLKLLLALSFFDKRYCLYLKTLSYICSQTRTTIANYCLLPWERMKIVQGILGENLFFFFLFFSCKLWWLLCSLGGTVLQDPFGKPLLAKCSVNTSFIYHVLYRVENLSQVLDFRAVNMSAEILCGCLLWDWLVETKRRSRMMSYLGTLIIRGRTGDCLMLSGRGKK